MKIYDCFLLNNELSLLEIRLKELYKVIDFFVIVESTHTFQGRLKPLHLKDNWNQFKTWHEKIIHVIVDDMPNDGNAWHNEHHQRNSILRGINGADSEDMIIISDCDEIPKNTIIQEIRQDSREIVGLRIPYFNFKFNYMLVDNIESYHVWITAGRKKYISNPEQFRNNRFGLNNLQYNSDDGKVKIYEHAGWHFTYLGDSDWIKDKIKSFAHIELNKEDILEKINVEEMIQQGVGFNPLDTRKFVKVTLDDYFPLTIKNNQDIFKQFIATDAKHSATNFLPK
jgi:hypothetical protein